MKLKSIFPILITILTIVTVLFTPSCKDNDIADLTEYSNNGQVYFFKLALTGEAAIGNRVDSITQKALADTKWVITQVNAGEAEIYNPIPLPYEAKVDTVLKIKMSFSPMANPTSVSLFYPSTLEPQGEMWKMNSSVDDDGTYEDTASFRTMKKLDYIIVTPQSANSAFEKKYKIKINKDEIDMDLIRWNIMPSLPTAGYQKALLKGDIMYNYVVKGNVLHLYTSPRAAISWSSQAVQGLPSSVKLESLIIFNNSFYVIDNDGNAFSSIDGISWNSHGNKNLVNIIGVLPSLNAVEDILLVIIKNGSDYRFATTIDMNTITPITRIKGVSESIINVAEAFPSFPTKAFSAVTKYDRSNSSMNALLVTGGYGFDNKIKNNTWMIRVGTSGLEVASSGNNNTFPAQENIKTFLYNGQLYALAKNVLYTSQWGTAWSKADVKAQLPDKNSDDGKVIAAPKYIGQTVLVDSDDFIWIFGGVFENTYLDSVWKGRLNRLIK